MSDHHTSDCAVHNMPAYPPGPCDCGLEARKQQRIQSRMAEIDALAPPIRALVHEYGYSVVKAFLDHKITKANAIKHLIETVQAGSYNGGINHAARERAAKE